MTTLMTLRTNETTDARKTVCTDHSTGEAPAHYGAHIARSLELRAGRGERQTDRPHPRVDLRHPGQPDEADVVVDSLRLPAGTKSNITSSEWTLSPIKTQQKP